MAKNSGNINVDTSKVDEMIKELNAKELRKAMRAGVRKSANIQRTAIQNELSASEPAAAKWRKDVETKIFSLGGGYAVHIVSRKKGSHAYILLFLSVGAGWKSPRNIKRGKRAGQNRGVIVGSNFFETGAERSKQPAADSLNSNINAAIARAIKKAQK